MKIRNKIELIDKRFKSNARQSVKNKTAKQAWGVIY